MQKLVGDDADVLANRNFQLLLLASLSSPLGASVVSPILTELAGPFGISNTRAGLLMAAFTAPAIVCIPLVGVLSDRYGRKPILSAGLVLFGAAGLAVPLATRVPAAIPLSDFRVALGLRLLQGIGYTGIAPILITAVGDIFDGDAEATAQGLRFTTVGVSLTAFPLLSGLLVAFAWQFPFALYAIALPTAVAVWLLFSEPTTAETEARGDVRALLARIRKPSVAATLIGRAVPGFLWFAFLTFNSVVIVEVLGGTPGEAGALVAVASVASAVATTQVGRLTARFGATIPTFAGLTLSGAGLSLVAVAPSVPVALAGGALIGGGFSVAITLYRTAITGLGEQAIRGGLVSVGESVGRVGSTTAPIVTGAAVAFLRPPDGAVTGEAVRTVLIGTAVACVAVGGLLLVVGEMETDAASGDSSGGSDGETGEPDTEPEV
jgi:ACDE family multidrug resistance protein